MALTKEREERLAKYLTEKKDDGFALLELNTNEATAKIKADGYDFTAEELKEFAVLMEKAAPAGDELDENALDDVSGGVVWVPAGAIAVLATAYYIYKRKKR